MDIAVLIAVCFLVMVFLASGIVVFAMFHQRKVLNHQLKLIELAEQKQKELLDASIEAEENERMRISSELHDDVGAALATLKLVLNRGIKSDNKELLDTSEELLDSTFQKVRSISHKLQPGNLQQFGLQVAIGSMAEIINKTEELVIDFVPNHSLPRLEFSVELGFYRILQELLQNLIKHAKVEVVRIESFIEANRFILIVKHNGNGIDNEQFEKLLFKSEGIGLKNILNRVNGIRGSINFTRGNDDYNYHILISVNLK